MTTPLVFIVEDEPFVQGMISDAIGEAGFVATASSAEEAIPMLNGSDLLVRAPVTDINLEPGNLTGWDVAERARQVQPELPVVYMTGAGAGDWSSRGVPNSVMIQKPFVPAQVITAISQLLS